MDIELLLKKFYDGVSTPEEERLLTQYFLNVENGNERWKDEQQLFRLLHDTQIQVPEEVSRRLEESIMQRDASSQDKPLRRKWPYWISGVAATVLLAIGLFLFSTRESSPPKMTDTFSDPKEAALVAQQTLLFMSSQLNKGLNKVNDADQEFQKVNQVLNKHLNN